MEIISVDNAKEGGKQAYSIIQNRISEGAKVLGLATGSTPETLYQEMVAGTIDFSEMIAINLDEYVGLGAEDEQSYQYFMEKHLFSLKPFKETYIPNGKAKNWEEECKRYDQIIESHPIDLQILGIGRNAHIGFNEPGTPFNQKTHVVSLTSSTISANQRYFKDKSEVPTHAFSMGIGSIMRSKEIILMAFGEEKAEAVKNMVKGEVTEAVPASVLQEHDKVTVIIDRAAGSLL